MDTHEHRNDGPPGGHSHPQVALLPHQLALVAELEFRPEDIFWERRPGQVELNPLLLARIAERIQFDGDVPELRFGNLPEGGKPAVPVESSTTDPVLLGLMLGSASLDVLEELDQARKIWEGALEAQQTSALATTEPMPVFSARGYEAGACPVPRQVNVQPVDALFLSEVEKQTAAFSVVATTQGRNSALPQITALVREGLEAHGLQLQYGEALSEPLVQAVWTFEVTQAKAINPKFSPLTTAGASLLRDLLRGLPSGTQAVVLVVKPIHTIHERVVGWRAALHG